MTTPVNRSIQAVLLGTFTLRFSTGLTGGLFAYYAAQLPKHGGVEMTAFLLGLMMATYFIAELILSPGFGVLSDHLGAHRVMQWGPVFGAIAVVLTFATTDLFLLGVTRFIEGAAAGASVPSILGYIAIATSRDVPLRGRTVARVEAATIAGLGIGLVAAGPMWEVFARVAFLINAGLYAVSYAIYRWGVADVATHGHPPDVVPVHSAELRPAGFDFARYRKVVSSPRVWLLAPTWIALNAVIGTWTSQSIFQLVREPSRERSEKGLDVGQERRELRQAIRKDLRDRVEAGFGQLKERIAERQAEREKPTEWSARTATFRPARAPGT